MYPIQCAPTPCAGRHGGRMTPLQNLCQGSLSLCQPRCLRHLGFPGRGWPLYTKKFGMQLCRPTPCYYFISYWQDKQYICWQAGGILHLLTGSTPNLCPERRLRTGTVWLFQKVGKKKKKQPTQTPWRLVFSSNKFLLWCSYKKWVTLTCDLIRGCT